MNKFLRALVVVGAVQLAALPVAVEVTEAQTIVQVTAVPSPAGIISTKFRDGDPGDVNCTTWTCTSFGTATGQIEEVSATSLIVTASGPDDLGNVDMAYKEFTDSDVQVCGTMPTQPWGGYAEPFTGGGVRIMEGLSATPTFFANNWVTDSSDTPRFKSGTVVDNDAQQGDPTTALPETLCITFSNSANEWKGWQTNNGTDFTQVGQTVVHDPSGTLYAGIFATPSELNQSTVITMTNVVASSTITINTDDPGPDPETTCTAPVSFPPTNSTVSSGMSITTNLGCRNGNDIVLGWDLSTPTDANISARSGTFNNNSSVPAYFKGRHLYKCNIQWDEVEPVNDNADPNVIDAADFDWSTVEECFDKIGTATYDGIILNVRHTVAYIKGCPNGVPNNEDVFPEDYSAPQWAQDIAALDPQGCKSNFGGFKVFNINLDNSAVRAEVKEFIRAFTLQNFKTREMWQIMHMASSSRGEECCGGLTNASMFEIIDEWTNGFGSNAYKLAWLIEQPPETFERAVDVGGTGARGGAIENWKRHQYTPGEADKTGQVRDANGYFTINPDFLPISEGRHWMDEMEFLTQSDNMYMGAGIRSMQMRRGQLWIALGSQINPRLDDWMSTIMAHQPSTIAEAFAWLMESRARLGTIYSINNLERHLLNRETLGATSSSNKIDDGTNVTGNALFPITDTACNYAGDNHCLATAWSRRENNASNVVGFALEDSFWPTSLTHDAVIKVVYEDAGSCTVNIRNSTGATIGTWTTGTSGTIRTVTRFVDNFSAPAAGLSKDLDLETTTGCPVDFLFVRVIKNGGAYAPWD